MIVVRRAAALLSLAAAVVGCGLAPTGAPAPIVRGPLSSRPQQPVFLTNLALRPRRPVTQPQGTWAGEVSVGHTSLYEVGSGGGARAAFDGELSHIAWRTRYGLDDDTDVELELAAVYGTSGFLDHFVDQFHELLLLPSGGRGTAADDQYEMELRRGGVTAFALEEDRVNLADAPLVLTRRVRDGARGGPTVALRAGVDLPLGSEDRGAGNGALDWGAGVLGEHLLGRWSVFWGADLIAGQESPGFEAAELEVREQVHAHAGAELRWNDRTSLLLQLTWTGPITRSVELEEIDREILDLGIGAAWDLPRGARLRCSFHEDLVAATGMDFSLLVGLGWGF
jgi:hypothetical protein